MITQRIHEQNAVLGAALGGTQARHDAILNNLTNVDTPRFTARRVEFESALASAVDHWRNTGELDLSGTRPALRQQEGGFAFRMDGNNVDFEREMVALFSNSVRYEALVNSVLHNSRVLNSVLQGR